MATLLEVLCLLLAKHLCYLVGSSIGNGKLHVVSDRLALKVVRHVAILLTILTTTNIVHSRLVDSLPSTLSVDTLDALSHSIRHGDDTWRAHHTAIIPAPKVPDRQEALLVADVNHGVDNIVHALRVCNGHQRKLSTVGIPQREGSIGVVTRILVNLVVSTTICAVNIREE